MSCAVTRMRLAGATHAALEDVVTPSVSAILRMSSFFPLNANADVRAITLRPGTCASALMISSASPSLKYSSSAIAAHVGERQHGDRRSAARRFGPPRAQLLQRRLEIAHRLKAMRRLLGEAALARSSAAGECSGGGSSRTTAFSVSSIDVALEDAPAREQFVQHRAEG